MISIRKHIDNYRDGAGESINQLTGAPDVAESFLSEFRGLLLAIGQCADRAVPSLGIDLDQKMTGLQKTLVQHVTADLLSHTNKQARSELSHWADCALSHHHDIERELREVISVVTAAAGSLSERDAKYTKEIGDLTGSIHSIAEENDLARMRRSIIEGTRALTACVARMAEESKAEVHHLTAEVQEYRSRLEEAERVSQTDPLTSLANRRALEKHLEARVAGGKPFSLIMIDLNDFKAVNDRFGHLAGDDLLKQFAEELNTHFTRDDMVGRWGGDEFIGVVASHLDEARARVERIRKWALGEYKIAQGDRQVKILLGAALGVAEWDGGETGPKLLARVDQEVYRAKESSERTRV